LRSEYQKGIPHGVSAGLDDSKEKTSVIPVETPEIDTGQPGEAVQGGAVAVVGRGLEGTHA